MLHVIVYVCQSNMFTCVYMTVLKNQPPIKNEKFLACSPLSPPKIFVKDLLLRNVAEKDLLLRNTPKKRSPIEKCAQEKISY
jgi:hypothetical protein